LATQRFAARFHAAFVVAFAGPTEARLEEIVRGERRKPRRQHPLAAHENPDHCGFEIVVRQARGGSIKVREGADVPIEETDLVLALVNPREVAARVHQPHQEEPRFLPFSLEVDEDLEEIDLGQIARSIQQCTESRGRSPVEAA
jgi:hypothetical protein